MEDILFLIILTLLPGLELRLSIPYGLASGIPFEIVFPICVITNFFLGIFIFILLQYIEKYLKKISLIKNFYEKIVLRTREKAHPYVEKYGTIGIGLFIAIPLPGSGTYTGALAAFLLGLNLKEFSVANALGIFIAGILVGLISLGAINFF